MWCAASNVWEEFGHFLTRQFTLFCCNRVYFSVNVTYQYWMLRSLGLVHQNQMATSLQSMTKNRPEHSANTSQCPSLSRALCGFPEKTWDVKATDCTFLYCDGFLSTRLSLVGVDSQAWVATQTHATVCERSLAGCRREVSVDGWMSEARSLCRQYQMHRRNWTDEMLPS